jgi:DNA-binding response OmpR family regulator
MRVLLLEDDEILADRMDRRLRTKGLAVDRANCVDEAFHLVAELRYDCFVLDRVVPGGDGLELVGKLQRIERQVPVLVVSGCYTRVKDRVAALEAGADDYLTKPFNLDELVCRVLALCRRAGQIRPPVIQVGDLTVDSSRRCATRDGRSIDLTALEFTILELLASRPGEVLTRAELWEHCWGERSVPYSNALDVHVGSLRRKLGSPRLIRTRRGTGYSIEPPQ